MICPRCGQVIRKAMFGIACGCDEILRIVVNTTSTAAVSADNSGFLKTFGRAKSRDST